MEGNKTVGQLLCVCALCRIPAAWSGGACEAVWYKGALQMILIVLTDGVR